MGKPDGRRSFRRSTLISNIKTDLPDVRSGYMEWTDVAQDRGWWWALVNAVTNRRVP
jgi:hypothetical protein